jgi:4,5-dihydroxyphthalate decarboxylase
MEKPLTAIPVFPARAFRHSYVFINTKSGIREPKDLMGKRLGLAEFQQTATVWIRGILQHEYGVKLEDIEWFTWVPRSRMEMEMPKRYKITHLAPDRKPDQMLFDGELDAIMVPSLFPSLFNPPPHIRRLFEDYPNVEVEYYRKTGIFPIMHSVSLRQDMWEKHPWIARSLFKAFQRAKEDAYARLNDLTPYKLSLAWLRGPVEEQRRILGDDPWPYGLEKNRHVVETLMTYLHEQGLAAKKLPVEALFAPNTLDL